MKNGLEKEQVLIAPGDMLFRNLDQYPFKKHQCWMAVTKLLGDQWSFAKISTKGLIIETAEKRRISDWASVGLYNFATGSQLLEIVKEQVDALGELYIAPLYNNLIQMKSLVYPISIDPSDVVDLGTPKSYYSNIPLK